MSQWVLHAVAFLCGLSVALPVYAASTINTQQPAQNAPYNAAPIRENFGAAANDVNALQRMNLGTSPPSSPSYGTLWLRQPTSGTTYTLNIWIASAATWAPIARIDGATGYWEPPVGGGILPSLISDATTDLGSVPNAALYVTGSQSVASFGASAPPGQLKFLIFTDAATLIYNPTYMILPGNSNFTAGANNTAIMLSLGQGKWRMISSGSGGSGSCDIFTATTSGCVPASGGGTVNFLRADGTWVPAGGDTSFTIAAGFTNTVGTLNIGDQTITNNSTLSEQYWVTQKSGNYTVNADNGGTSDTGVLLVAIAPGIIFSAPNPSPTTKGNTYQFGTDGTNGFTLTTVGGAATIYGCPGPNTGATSFTFGAMDTQIVDDGVNYKCTSGAAITPPPGSSCGTGTTNTVMKFITDTVCGDSHITDDGLDIIATAGIAAAASDIRGGDITLLGGTGDTTGRGGNITSAAGAAGATGNGGTVAISGGAATLGDAGSISIFAGATASGSAGTVDIKGGNSDNGQAGGVAISGGLATAFGAGGYIQLTGGSAALGGGAPGYIALNGGTSLAGNAGAGGGISLTGGDGDDAFVGGGIGLVGGNGGAGGGGGSINITPGNAGTGTDSGGHLLMVMGQSSAGSGGYIYMQPKPTTGTQSTVPGDGDYQDGYTQIAFGHIVGGLGTSPGDAHGALSSCGGGTPAFETSGDNDTRGVITVGSGVVTACTMTFKRVWNTISFSSAYVAPKCFATNVGATPNAISVSARSITAVTFTFAADINTTGGAFQYWCVQ